MSTTLTQEPIFATAAEQEQPRGVIRQYHGSLPNAELIGPDNETLELPRVVYDVLTRVVQAMSRGLAVAVLPLQLELTTQQAAEILNISRRYLVQLLDQGAIPYTKVGTHRRIRFGDVRAYKETRDQQRRSGLDRLARLSDELGMYDRDFPKEDKDE